MKIAIVGAGAAGFFAAINLKEFLPNAQISIFEKSDKLLSKVLLSGGGRCNCTNSFKNVGKLKDVYPRGYNVLGKLFKKFSHSDTINWFEKHGVRLFEQEDGRIFPKTQDSQTIVDCFLSYSKKYGIRIERHKAISALGELKDFDFVVLTTGGYSNKHLFEDLGSKGHRIEKSLPSLFALETDDEKLKELSGVVVSDAELLLAGTKYKVCGDVLLTHFGFSGPAVLRLSSYSAIYLGECRYKTSLLVNWTGKNYSKSEEILEETFAQYPQKIVYNVNPFDLPRKLWQYLAENSLKERAKNKLSSLNRKDINRLLNILCSDTYNITDRYAHKEEFVTCGGVALESLDTNTLQSKTTDNLYFAGEVLDIDGITGGFNLQSAWTTAFVVAKSIYERSVNQN